MRCLFLTFIIATMMVSNSFALLCGLFGRCPDIPHNGNDKYYIGYTDEDCINVYVCKRRRNDICIQEYGRVAGGNVGGFTCNYPTLYDECYNKSGGKKGDWIDPKVVSFISPWSSSHKDCKPTYTRVNIKDKRCYSGPKNNDVINSNMSTRTARSIYKVNGRCLTPAGWCDC